MELMKLNINVLYMQYCLSSKCLPYACTASVMASTCFHNAVASIVLILLTAAVAVFGFVLLAYFLRITVCLVR